jgi:hypothetical protein
MQMHGVPRGITHPPASLPVGAGEEHPKTTGTLVLVFVFLAAFAIYYFVNWKLLSLVWQIG